MTEIQLCVAPRKDGRPCRAVGRWFDPARNGPVCDTPAGPEINEKFQRRIRGLTLLAERVTQDRLQSWENVRRNVDLKELPKALGRFLDGELLTPKTRKLLEAILAEDTRRKQANRRGVKL